MNKLIINGTVERRMKICETSILIWIYKNNRTNQREKMSGAREVVQWPKRPPTPVSSDPRALLASNKTPKPKQRKWNRRSY